MAAGSDYMLVTADEARSFVRRCMESVGTCADHAAALADLLVDADLRGHYSHGLNRLHMYVGDVRSGTTKPSGEPRVLSEKGGVAWVDGCDLLGVVVGRYCMRLAMEKARQFGIAFVTCKGSTHFGICSHYGEMALHEGLIGMCMTNGARVVAPTRTKEQFFATNPICVTAPAAGGDSFVLDMATSAVAIGKCEVKLRLGQPIPPGWGVDKNGRQTLDPAEVMDGGGVMPLGGFEETSGYKGYGLAMMVEMLTAILSGASIGPHVREWFSNDIPANLGHCFLALDPSCFAAGFDGRMKTTLDELRDLEPLDAAQPVLVPGDPERQSAARCAERGGIAYHVRQLEHLQHIAEQCGVAPLSAAPLI